MVSKKASIRAATRIDIDNLGSDTFGKTVRAYVIDVGGEAIAISGVLHTHLNQAFSLHTEKADKYPVMKMKLAKKLVELMKTYQKPVYALASEEYKTSDSLLLRLGFELDEVNEFGRLYKWQWHHK